jgi:LPXTG-motif cell wall-anchored protein
MISYYIANHFPLPTAGRGPFLLQTSANAQPTANGGVSFYTPASTANPTGWRPWNSRLGFYEAAQFALPSTGLAIPAQRFANGAMGQIDIFGVEIDPTLLGLAGAALLAGIYLYGPKRRRRRR